MASWNPFAPAAPAYVDQDEAEGVDLEKNWKRKIILNPAVTVSGTPTKLLIATEGAAVSAVCPAGCDKVDIFITPMRRAAGAALSALDSFAGVCISTTDPTVVMDKDVEEDDVVTVTPAWLYSDGVTAVASTVEAYVIFRFYKKPSTT